MSDVVLQSTDGICGKTPEQAIRQHGPGQHPRHGGDRQDHPGHHDEEGRLNVCACVLLKPPGGKLPPGGFFPGLIFPAKSPTIGDLSSAVRCGKWSEQDSREELLIPSARRPSASPPLRPGAGGGRTGTVGRWRNPASTRSRQTVAAACWGGSGRRPPPVWAGAARAFRDSLFVRLCRPAEGGTESGLHKILRSFPVFY